MNDTQLSADDIPQALAPVPAADPEPLSKVLRLATKDVHAEIESTDGASLLVHGRLSKAEYVRYLMMLYYVYDALETALDRHATHPVLERTYNPPLLARAPRIAADIAHLLGVPEPAWQSAPAHAAFRAAPPPGVAAYVARIDALSAAPERLLGHAYVRYLGDLSGGQEIRRRVARAYGLAEGCGTSFYAFERLGEPGTEAGVGDMARIKAWFRSEMDESAGADEGLKREIADEAIRAFRLSMGLFADLRPPVEVDASNPLASEAPHSFSMKFTRGVRETFWSILRLPALVQ